MYCEDTSTGSPRQMHWNITHLLALALWIPVGASLLAHVSPNAATAIWLLLCLLGFGLAERLWPHRSTWRPSSREIGFDATLLGAAAIVDGALRHAGLWIAQWVASDGTGWASDWPLVLAVPAAVLLGELGPYGLHRWSHSHPWGWRWHRLHHAPEQVNTSNSVRVHPLNLAWNVISRGLMWWMVGFSAEALAWASMFMLLQSVAVHANVQGRIGPLSWLIGSAEAHRLHHSKLPDEALNYGTAVPLWDQLFGSWRTPRGPEPLSVGLHR
jgi:sterol desaturase/sphingolipid hydroxylase (fatty acid hydroxylase superfamily)